MGHMVYSEVHLTLMCVISLRKSLMMKIAVTMEANVMMTLVKVM